MKSLKEAYLNGWQSLVKVDKYEYAEEMLGAKIFAAGGGYVHRKDFVLRNLDGYGLENYFRFALKCTIFLPQCMLASNNVPCVLFLHTHGGSRVEGLFLKPYVLPKLALCFFDFAGSGLSEGEYITLGPKEKRDAKLVMDHVRKHFGVSNIFLWGRSMGAVTSILLANEFPEDISAMILDSPFNDLGVMVKDVVTSGVNVPRCIIGCVLSCMAKTVKSKTGVNILNIKPNLLMQNIKIPCFFIVGKEDTLARPSRVKELFLRCGSEDKVLFLVEGEHATNRDPLVIRRGFSFLLKCYSIEQYKLEAAKHLSFETATDAERTLLFTPQEQRSSRSKTKQTRLVIISKRTTSSRIIPNGCFQTKHLISLRSSSSRR